VGRRRFLLLRFHAPGPIHQQSHAAISLALSALGMSLTATNEIQAAFTTAGFEGIIREERNSWWRDDLGDLCQQMYYLGVKSGGGNLLLWGAQVEERERLRRG